MAQLLRDFVKIENDFTIIPNEISRNKEMKSSTKNILIAMLSLPPTWDFSIAGITTCVRESYDTVQKALVELEQMGYITRNREHREDGTFGAMIYTIHQFPVPKDKNTYKNNHRNQDVKNPKQVKSNTGKNQDRKKPVLENSAQLSTDNKLNKDSELNIDNESSTDDELNTDCNSFSKEKDTSNSPRGMCNSFSGEKKDTRRPKQNKPLSEKELEQANYKMPFRACEIAYRLTQNKDLANNTMQFFQYFLDERKKHTGTWHIPLSDTTLAKVVATLIEDIKVDRGDYEDTYFSLVINEPGNNDYEEVVDKYFKTKFKSKVDYSIVHFTQENVLINIMNHCGKENWCMSA